MPREKNRYTIADLAGSETIQSEAVQYSKVTSSVYLLKSANASM